MKKNPIIALAWNLVVVYVLFTLCRFVFLLTNWKLYEDTMSWGHALELFGAGLIFDTTAIIYTNLVIIVAFLLPLHWKENPVYYKVIRWIYVVCNSLALYTNLADCAYYPFTGKRTTTTVFAEFSHEGAGSMMKILGEQMLANWYLVAIGVGMTCVLWKAFMPKMMSHWPHASHATAPLWKYYLTMTTAMVAAVVLCVGGARGGFAHAVRPITISNANQYVARSAETGIVLNTPFSIYRTLSKKPMVVPDYMSDSEARSLYTPIHTPCDSLPFQRKNVVVFIIESYGQQHFGFYNPARKSKGFTPFLDSLITHGAMTWRYAYANGRKSIEGMPSTLSSLPNYVEPLFLTPASLNSMSGLARELGEKKGYETGFFHGAQNGSMGFQAFARATGFKHYYGRTEYNEDPRFNGDDDYDGTWAIFDEEFLQYFALTMNGMRQPFMTAVFTATSHTPYTLPKRYKGVFPKGEHPVQECVAYTDHAMQHFFDTARKQPWFKNTLFVITADHSSALIEPYYTTSLGKYTVPIILYAPGDSTLRGYDQLRVVEQTDIMPTVLSYLHYDQPYLAFGKDMLHTPVAESFALHWVPEANGYQFVKGDYVIDFDGQQVTAAYRYRTDSLLRDNVLRKMPQAELLQMERQIKSVIQQYMQRMTGDSLVIKNH